MTAPTEVRGRRAQRHKASTVSTAARLYADGEGWTPTEISRYLAKHGIIAAESTIRGWVAPTSRSEAQRLHHAAHARRMRAAKGQPTEQPVTESDTALTRALRLRVEHGLSYCALSVVLGEYHDLSMDADQVRYHLTRMGAPRNPNKARALARRAAQNA